MNTSSIWEGLFVSIRDSSYKKEVVLGNIYRPPFDNNNDENINLFISELNPIIGQISDNYNRDLLIAGDFNINLLHINYCNKEHFGNFLDLFLGYSLFPKITFPSRLRENSCSLIDNIFGSLSPNIITSPAGKLFSRISDHFPYFLSVYPNKDKGLKSNTRYVKQRIKSKEAYEKLLNELSSCDVVSMLDPNPYCDPNKNYNTLHNYLTEMKEKHLPYKFVKFDKYRHKNSKWITHGVIKSIKNRYKLYRKLKCTDQSSERYVILKNRLSTYNKILKKTIREAKSSYYLLSFTENKANTRKTWSMINVIICKNKNSNNGIKAIMKDGNLIKDPKAIVENFNNFFINIGPNLVRNININPNKSFETYLTKHIISSFNFSLVNENEVNKILKSLHTKTSSGHDGMSVKLLKFLSPALIRPLTIIINQSLITGIFPKQLK